MKKEQKEKEQKETPEKPTQSPMRINYYDPLILALEQRIRKEVAIKHKAGELWRKRHTEELTGLLRDPDMPQAAKELVLRYVDAWEQFDQVQGEIKVNDEDIKKAENAGEPLLVIKYKQYKEILEENKSLRIIELAKDIRLLHANQIPIGGVMLLSEKEYRELGFGEIFVGNEASFNRKRNVRDLVNESKDKKQEVENEEEPGIA